LPGRFNQLIRQNQFRIAYLSEWHADQNLLRPAFGPSMEANSPSA
jgi:hypothetical protein